MYVEMLFEYMQRRSELENDDFNAIVEQSNNEEMTTFKTIFQVAREEAREEGKEEGKEEGIEKGIKIIIRTTRMKDAAIAKEFDVSEEYVKKIRQEMKILQS